MRSFPLMLSGVVVLAGLGCARHKAIHVMQPAPRQERPAAALVFTPAIAYGEPEVDLSRDVRQAAAFLGFEEPTATFFAVRSDDRQTSDGTDRFVRRSVSVKVGVTHR